jgi:hypothetical protein
MLAQWFRFNREPDRQVFRSRLRAEIGKRRSREGNLDVSWRPDRESDAGVFEVLSMDAIAIVYAGKVCLEIGGEPADGPWAPPDWATAKWVEIPWTKKLRLTFGPTKLYREVPTATARDRS